MKSYFEKYVICDDGTGKNDVYEEVLREIFQQFLKTFKLTFRVIEK